MDPSRITVSPFARDSSEIPEMPLGTYLLNNLRANMPRLRGRDWVIDTHTNYMVKFDMIEEMSTRMGSALTRLGFKKGDVLYYVTYNTSELYVLLVAVWRIGGITRGSFQVETKQIYTSQMKETLARFVLVDSETKALVCEAMKDLDHGPITLLSFGFVENATRIMELLHDDGSAFPQNVVINPRTDVAMVGNTSGSTGNPKGVLLSHYNLVAASHARREFFSHGTSLLSCMKNFSGANIQMIINSICMGGTVYNIPKFNKDQYFKLLHKYKPEVLVMYTYLASWFARCPQLPRTKLPFVRSIFIFSSVLDPHTMELLSLIFSHGHVDQGYGLTECAFISSTKLRADARSPALTVADAPDYSKKVLSTGRLLPYVKAKVIQPESGRVMGFGESGEIIVQSPCNMLGYLERMGQEPRRDIIDGDNWLHTGDLGFIDAEGNVFVMERINFVYKVQSTQIMPSEIEAVLQEHDAVHLAGVVGLPNPTTDHLTRAFVMLRPGRYVSAAQLEEFVEQRLHYYKRLHGGVRFVQSLPINPNGKLDRKALLKFALEEDQEL